MKIGIPKEIILQENRVGLTPVLIQKVISAGHQIFIETQAGVDPFKSPKI